MIFLGRKGGKELYLNAAMSNQQEMKLNKTHIYTSDALNLSFLIGKGFWFSN